MKENTGGFLMSDRMTGMSFDQLMNWVTEELENHGTLFGLHRAYKAPEEALTIFGRDLETPIGPAAAAEQSISIFIPDDSNPTVQ